MSLLRWSPLRWILLALVIAGAIVALGRGVRVGLGVLRDARAWRHAAAAAPAVTAAQRAREAWVRAQYRDSVRAARGATARTRARLDAALSRWEERRGAGEGGEPADPVTVAPPIGTDARAACDELALACRAHADTITRLLVLETQRAERAEARADSLDSAMIRGIVVATVPLRDTIADLRGSLRGARAREVVAWSAFLVLLFFGR